MAKNSFKGGNTGRFEPLTLFDDSGNPASTASGLDVATITCYYRRAGSATASVAVTLSLGTTGTWSSDSLVEADPTNMPGLYDFCPSNTSLAAAASAGASSVTFYFYKPGAVRLASIEIALTGMDFSDAAAGGMSRLDATITSRPTASTIASFILSTPANLLATNASGQVQSSSLSGYSAPPSAATVAAAVWEVLLSTISTAGSLGKLIKDNINATINSRAIPADVQVTVNPNITINPTVLDTNERTNIAAAVVATDEIQNIAAVTGTVEATRSSDKLVETTTRPDGGTVTKTVSGNNMTVVVEAP